MDFLTLSRRFLFSLLLLTLIPTGSALGGDTADEEAVRQAALDYVEGIYEIAPERIERSVHPELHKIGFGRSRDGGEYARYDMTFEQLVELAKRWNADGRVGADAVKKVILYEVLDKTASLKLVADWGIDYMHLAKMDGRWVIVNVMWQSHPPKD